MISPQLTKIALERVPYQYKIGYSLKAHQYELMKAHKSEQV